MESTQRVPELRPEIVFLFELVEQLVEGRIRIPRFQRPFVWRRDQMTDLLDSIKNQYPIGSLLTWETDSDIVSLESIGPITVPAESKLTSIYVIDGHQRLSTIAGALVSAKERTSSAHDDDPGRWSLFYNAKDGAGHFEHLDPDGPLEAYQFPMAKILDTFEYLEECQRVLEADKVNGREYVSRIQDVVRAFQSYKIPVIHIRQTGLTDAVEIFARLNSKGQAMTADQMVSALLYRQDSDNPFDLAAEISESMSILNERGFGGVDRTVVLRALLAAAGEDIYRTDWTRIAKDRRNVLLEKLRGVIPDVNKSLAAAVEFLRTELGVATDRLLPYAMQLTVLSAFFFAAPDISPAQRALLKKWFWVSSFSGWFGGANPSRVNALVRDVIDHVAANRDRPEFATVDLSAPALPLPRSFDMRSARTRTLLLVMLSLNPRTRTGEPITAPSDLLRMYGPEAVGYVVSGQIEDKELSRSPANRLFSSDRGQARTWLLDCPQDSRESIWASHAVPPEAIDLLAKGDVTGFLWARLAMITHIERSFMAACEVTPPPTDIPAYAPIDSD